MENSDLKIAHILIVDDEQANIDVLTGLLEMRGYLNVYQTTNPRLVADMFQEIKPDIILLDLMMPHLTGFQVMEQLKPLVPDNTYLPVLVLTADVSPESKLRALANGAKDFLTKPFDLTEVDLRIKNLLETRFLHQQLANQNQILEEKVMQRTSELRRINIDLTIAKEKAEASDQLKTAFINNISHEIRTPLNGILGFGQIIMDPSLNDEEKNQYLEILQASSDRLMNTVTDFMDISLIVSGNITVNKKNVNIDKLMNEKHSKFLPLCEAKNLELVLRRADHNIENIVNTDIYLFEKIIYHLLDNALKFTKKGQISFGYTVKDSYLEFFVSDTGIGIAKEAQQQMFKCFTQENPLNTRDHEGSGLGLSIAKSLIELLGGKIWIESEKEKGTTIYFTHLYKENHDKTQLSPENKNLHQSIEVPMILVVEDDDYNFFYLEALFRKMNTEIIRANTGKEAVEICLNNHLINLVLMDLKLPEMNGFEATRQIKSIRKNLPIIAITAYAMISDKDMAIEAGCDDYISKPVPQKLLFEIINRCMSS